MTLLMTLLSMGTQADAASRGVKGAPLELHASGCTLATVPSMQTSQRTSPAVPVTENGQSLQPALSNRILTWEVRC